MPPRQRRPTVFHLDPYGLPDLAYQERTGQGDPLSISEFSDLLRGVFSLTRELSKRSSADRSLLRILSKHLTLTLSAILAAGEIRRRLLEAGFDPVLTPLDALTTAVGARDISPDLVHAVAERRFPELRLWLEPRALSPSKAALTRAWDLAPAFRGTWAYRPNPWTLEHLHAKGIAYHRSFDGSFWGLRRRSARLEEPRPAAPLHPLAERFVNGLAAASLLKGASAITPMIARVTDALVRRGERDLEHVLDRLARRRGRSPRALYTGTTGHWRTRVVAEALRQRGVECHAFMHAGALDHIAADFDARAFIEYDVPHHFYVFNASSVPAVEKTVRQWDLPVTIRATAAAGPPSSEPLREVGGCTAPIRRVVVVGLCLDPTMRRPHLPSDLMYYDYKRLLLEALTSAGVDIFIKPHPKGARRLRSLVLEAFPEVTYLDGLDMQEAIALADALVVPFVDSTSFNESLRSSKAVIVVDPSGIELTAEARETLAERAGFVPCGFDDRGLAWLDAHALHDALGRRYRLDDRFARRYQG